MKIFRCIIIIFLSVSWVSSSFAKDDEIFDDLIFSDIPIWPHGGSDQVWPQSFFDEDSFGCVHALKLGDWEITDLEYEHTEWRRFENYGAFHCWMNYYEDYERESLGGGKPKPTFFVDLGMHDTDSGKFQLAVLQIGIRPGSQYLFLGRAEDESRDEWLVLQSKCPRKNIRKGVTIDILLTEYCVINSARDMRRFAKKMLRLPPRAKLKFHSKQDDLADHKVAD